MLVCWVNCTDWFDSLWVGLEGSKDEAQLNSRHLVLTEHQLNAAVISDVVT